MPDPMIGEIRMFAGNFAPKNWALCNGQLLAISSNTALFSILGTYYGGNGTSNFALPNLQGRTPIGVGQGPGLTPRDLGELGGVEQASLIIPEMPAHTHSVADAGNSDFTKTTATSPASGAFGATDPNANPAINLYASGATGQNAASMGASPSGVNGGSTPHNNIQPSLAVSFIICLFGVFPARN